MDRSQLLGTTFDCPCGRQHTVPTRRFVYADSAFSDLSGAIRELVPTGQVLLISDTRTYAAAGEAVADSLNRQGVAHDLFILPDPPGESPAADDATRDYLLANTPEADLYIAVGSGVINDLVKWVSFLRNAPYIAVATAASMNGYASANVAATIDGLKVLFHAEACRAMFADPQVIADAPSRLTAAGLGDVLAKSVSSADWRLNRFLFNDYYCQFSVDLLKDLEPIYLNNPEGIRDRKPEAIEALFTALFYSSIAMTMTGTSSPASGGEHLVSHTLDMIAIRDGVHHDLHGRQVGVGSILAAAIYERLLAMDRPRFVSVPQHIDHGFWGSLAPVVEKEYHAKLPRLEQAATILGQGDNWNRLREIIQPDLVGAQRLKHCLQTAGAAHSYAQLQCNRQPLTRAFFTRAVQNANQMRQRFTVLDLAVMTGIIPEQVDTLIDQWLAS